MACFCKKKEVKPVDGKKVVVTELEKKVETDKKPDTKIKK